MTTQSPADVGLGYLGPIISSWYTRPLVPPLGFSGVTLSDVTARFGLFHLPYRLLSSRLAYSVNGGGTSVVHIALYSILDNNRAILLQGPGALGVQIVQQALSLPFGVYWIGVCDDGSGTHPGLDFWSTPSIPLINDSVPAGGFSFEGNLAILAGNLPEALSPLNITPAGDRTLVLRFD